MCQSIEFIKYLTDIFTSNNILYWLDCGTLLGAYREGNILKTDVDIDISILDTDSGVVQSILESLIISGDIKKLEGGKWYDSQIYQICSLKFISLRVDIYVFKKCELFSYHKFFSSDTEYKLKINNNDINTLSSIKLGDYYFNCPSNLEHYLKVRYGKNFMIPQTRCYELDKEWDEMWDNVGNEYLFND